MLTTIFLIFLIILICVVLILLIRKSQRLKAIQDRLVFETVDMRDIYDCLNYHEYLSAGEIRNKLEYKTRVIVPIEKVTKNLYKLKQKGCLDETSSGLTGLYRKLI